MDTHSAIIVRLGGIREVARMLGHNNHTTVQGWHDRDKIPLEHWPALIERASEAGKPLSREELMPPALRDVA
jgi:hypothetical protein